MFKPSYKNSYITASVGLFEKTWNDEVKILTVSALARSYDGGTLTQEGEYERTAIKESNGCRY